MSKKNKTFRVIGQISMEAVTSLEVTKDNRLLMTFKNGLVLAFNMEGFGSTLEDNPNLDELTKVLRGVDKREWR